MDWLDGVRIEFRQVNTEIFIIFKVKNSNWSGKIVEEIREI